MQPNHNQTAENRDQEKPALRPLASGNLNRVVTYDDNGIPTQTELSLQKIAALTGVKTL